MRRVSYIVLIVVAAAGWLRAAQSAAPAPSAKGGPPAVASAKGGPPPAASAKGGYVLERDAQVARTEPGTHNGGGSTVGYSFFNKVPGLRLVFRKRALKAGSGIGYHEQKEDEIYYVLSGKGEMTIDGKAFEVGPGDAILTRPGSSHGLKQKGADDLVVLINYEQAPK